MLRLPPMSFTHDNKPQKAPQISTHEQYNPSPKDLNLRVPLSESRASHYAEDPTVTYSLSCSCFRYSRSHSVLSK